jgi:hypothetical protein
MKITVELRNESFEITETLIHTATRFAFQYERRGVDEAPMITIGCIGHDGKLMRREGQICVYKYPAVRTTFNVEND